MICCTENNSIAVLNCFLSSIVYSILAFLTENVKFLIHLYYFNILLIVIVFHKYFCYSKFNGVT